MKKIAKFLLAVFIFAPAYVCAAPVATTAGNNLTAYNGASESYINNQWNNAMNPRVNVQQTAAKADFGNCEAIVLRCAKPKCSGGGCANVDVAKSIVSGCVKSNATCKKHGDDLIDYIAAQLVSSSSAAVSAAQAQAAAAQSAAEQNAAAMQQQMAQMQQQMQAMQQQNSQQMASLQSALEESQRASENAATVAAANAVAQQQASVANPDTGLTATQEAAAKSGVSDDVITRATITGQIMTSMEGVDQSLDKLKTTMRDAFRYAGCNEINGDNCTGPKRVKKFKELAMKFFDPYDALVDNLEDALVRARDVGVPMADIYMMLSGSCNRWGEYLCQSTDTEGYKQAQYDTDNCVNGVSRVSGRVKQRGLDCVVDQYIPVEADTLCVLNKEIGQDEVQEKWLYPDTSSTGHVRIGCASSVLQGSFLGRRRASARKGGVNIDVLEYLIAQDAPTNCGVDSSNNKRTPDDCAKDYCIISHDDPDLRSATVSKSLPINKICCDEPNKTSKTPGSKTVGCTGDCDDENNSYISPVYGLCSVHAYNLENQSDNNVDEETRSQIKDNIALKSTVITQQMYKQYVMVESMIKRLKIMLEKEVLKASLQVAGASSSDSGDSGFKSNDRNIFIAGVENCNRKSSTAEVFTCLRSNYNTIVNSSNDGAKLNSSIVKQLCNDAKVANDNQVSGVGSIASCYVKAEENCLKNINDRDKFRTCLDSLNSYIRKNQEQIEENNRKYREGSRF